MAVCALLAAVAVVVETVFGQLRVLPVLLTVFTAGAANLGGRRQGLEIRNVARLMLHGVRRDRC